MSLGHRFTFSAMIYGEVISVQNITINIWLNDGAY